MTGIYVARIDMCRCLDIIFHRRLHQREPPLVTCPIDTTLIIFMNQAQITYRRKFVACFMPSFTLFTIVMRTRKFDNYRRISVCSILNKNLLIIIYYVPMSISEMIMTLV